MNVLSKLTLRTLRLNRKRSAVTIVGIILAAALITAVANLAVSFRASMVAYEKEASGDFHYCFQKVEPENLKYFENNRNIEKLGIVKELGYAVLEGCENPDKPYLYICSMDENAIQATALQLITGRMPENEQEIAVANHVRTNGRVDIGVGDVLKLTIGYRDGGDGFLLGQSNPYYENEENFCAVEEKEYTVVGLLERPSTGVEARMAPGYTAITGLTQASGPVNIYVTYTKEALKNGDQVTAGLLGVSEELYQNYMAGRELTDAQKEEVTQIASYVECNIWLIKWELLSFSNRTMNIVYAMGGLAILIIMVTGIFCIRNSFVISLTEKTRLYGMLSCVGMTRKQMRRLVYQEAISLGIAGIPLGIAGGALATAVVIQITGRLLDQAMGIPLVYKASVGAMLMGAVLTLVTVLLSAGQSARKAGKISPISAIRGNETVRIRRKELRTPALVGKLFGMGGVIAYKNLKRARVKYRTTVVAIVVSVAVFIGMTTFISLGFLASGAYYENLEYQLQVLLDGKMEEIYPKALEIAELDGVEYAQIRRFAERFQISVQETTFTEEYKKYGMVNDIAYISVVSIGEKAYREYCGLLGIHNVDENADQCILIDDFQTQDNDGGKIVKGKMFTYQAQDIVQGTMGEDTFSMEILINTVEKPMCLSNYSGPFLVVSDQWLERHVEHMYDSVNIFLQCEDPDQVEDIIQKDEELLSVYITNYAEEYRKSQALYLMISIFLYGFITVIALIGVTNIFNTITTNMELRSREFAMLKSVGMTGREFTGMIYLESLFYGVKALCIGIPLGVLLSYGFYRSLGVGMETPFKLPAEGIFISILAVFLLLFMIMRYSMKKAERKNIVETIQNENI